MVRYLKPAPDRVVRKLDGSPLAPEGEAIVMDSFWDRRLADEDVIEVEIKKGAAK